MSKRVQSPSNLESNTQDEDEEISLEKITKKRFNSNEKKINANFMEISKITKELVKQPAAKMKLGELKNLKNLRRKQEDIMMTIENQNIEKNIQTLLEKFAPPYCANCPNRRADRVCINIACGYQKYMQVICGKCHQDEHQKTINKSEIDIEEYFVKLSKFLNEEKYDEKNILWQTINIDKLDTIFDQLYDFRQKLASLRSKIENNIESYKSPKEIRLILRDCISKAPSLSYDCLQDQLANTKEKIIFEKNKFILNDTSKKFFVDFSNLLNDLEIIKTKTIKKNCLNYSFLAQKYALINQRQIIITGVMAKSNVYNCSVGSIQNQYFCKRFFSNYPNVECSKLLRGINIGNRFHKDMQIEMRIDFEKNYVDFYDYPDIKNLNASLDENKFSDQDYVIAFTFQNNTSIIIESFQELSYLEDLDVLQ